MWLCFVGAACAATFSSAKEQFSALGMVTLAINPIKQLVTKGQAKFLILCEKTFENRYKLPKPRQKNVTLKTGALHYSRRETVLNESGRSGRIKEIEANSIGYITENYEPLESLKEISNANGEG